MELRFEGWGRCREEEGGQTKPRGKEQKSRKVCEDRGGEQSLQNQRLEQGSDTDQAGRKMQRQVSIQELEMQANPAGGPKGGVITSQKHLPKDPRGAHGHPTKHQVLLELFDHGLK